MYITVKDDNRVKQFINAQAVIEEYNLDETKISQLEDLEKELGKEVKMMGKVALFYIQYDNSFDIIYYNNPTRAIHELVSMAENAEGDFANCHYQDDELTEFSKNNFLPTCLEVCLYDIWGDHKIIAEWEFDNMITKQGTLEIDEFYREV